MEILGLAIVVLIFLLGALYLGKFSLNKEPSNLRDSFVAKALASRMVGSLLKTNAAGCEQETIEDILKSCAEATQICDDGQDSCKYAEAEIGKIFSSTLEAWKKDYYFTVFVDENFPLLALGQNCRLNKKYKSVEPGEEFVPINPGTLHVKLEICT